MTSDFKQAALLCSSQMLSSKTSMHLHYELILVFSRGDIKTEVLKVKRERWPQLPFEPLIPVQILWQIWLLSLFQLFYGQSAPSAASHAICIIIRIFYIHLWISFSPMWANKKIFVWNVWTQNADVSLKMPNCKIIRRKWNKFSVFNGISSWKLFWRWLAQKDWYWFCLDSL